MPEHPFPGPLGHCLGQLSTRATRGFSQKVQGVSRKFFLQPESFLAHTLFLWDPKGRCWGISMATQCSGSRNSTDASWGSQDTAGADQLRKRQEREPGSTSVLMKDKTRPAVGQRAINSLVHSSTIFVAIFPGPKEERSYGQSTVTMAMSSSRRWSAPWCPQD